MTKRVAPPNYIRRLLEMQDRGELPPGLVDIDVAHDDWCATLTRMQPCDCDPDVSIRKQEN